MIKRILAAFCAAILIGWLSPERAMAQVSPQRTCGKSAFYDTNTNGATQLVAAGNTIFICGYTFATNSTVNIGLVFGTGTNCGAGTTKITPAYQFLATTSALAGIMDASPTFRGLSIPPGNALCLNTSAGVAVQAMVYFDNSGL